LFKPSPGGSDNYKVEYTLNTEKETWRQEKAEVLRVKLLNTNGSELHRGQKQNY